MSENLWRNPSFEGGWTHEPYNIAEIQIPLEHELEWDVGLPNPDDPDNHPLQQPEINVKNRSQIPDNEEEQFFFDGFWTFKAFGAWKAIRFRLTQHFDDLAAGAYTMVLPICPDLVVGYDANGNKIGADDPKSGQVRVIVDGDASPWQYLGGEKNLKQSNFVFDFSLLVSGPTSITIEFYLPHPLRQNGIFTDGLSLVHLGPDDPCECRGAPRKQYARTYVLIPRTMSAQMRSSIVAFQMDSGVTIGESADDAGIGDLDFREVIAINPSEIGTGLTADWFGEHYPGVVFYSITTDDPQTLYNRLVAGDYDEDDPDPPPPPPNPAARFFLPTLHLQTEQDGWLDFLEILCQKGIPPYAVKFVGGFESARKVKNIAQAYDVDILTIGRQHIANQDQYLKAADKKAAARHYLDTHKDSVTVNKIDLVSDLNETIATDNLETIRNAVAFSVELIPLVRNTWGGDVGTIALETAIGNPREGQQSAMLVPVAYEIVKASENARVPSFIGYHAYWWGRINPAILSAAGVISFTPSAHATGAKIVLPNALAAIKATQDPKNKLAGLFVRKAVDDYLANNDVAQAAIAYESGLIKDWKWHAGRSLEVWRPEFLKQGLDPLHIFTEIGVVASPDGGSTLLATEGWRSSACYNSDWDFYHDDIMTWQRLMRMYPVATAGTIFTVGDDYVGWGKFKLRRDQMIALAMEATL